MSKLQAESEIDVTKLPEVSYGPRIGKPSSAMPRTGEGVDVGGKVVGREREERMQLGQA